jgi:CDP-glycerol glycerophosphotransferase (TagB/SpsB family)
VFALKVIKSVIIYLLHYLCFLIPRKKNLWLYSSLNSKFLDNAKYFFLYNIKHHNEIRHIWITENDDTINYLRSKGFECYRKKTWKATWLALRAKVFIYSAYSIDISNPAFAGGAFLFNLWHGIPLKKIEYDITKGPISYLYNPRGLKEKLKRFSVAAPVTKKHSAILTTSSFLKKIFSNAFRVHKENILVAQYPRIMPFYWNAIALQKHIEEIEPAVMKDLTNKIKKFNEVWVYMPTWRDGNPSFIQQALPDFEALNKICKQKNILFLLKTHINTIFEKDISNLSNVQIADRNIDIYPLLPLTHVLITDYSSVFFDYSLLNKKLIFYPFDLADYLSRSRELYFDYKHIVCDNTTIYTFEALLEIINSGDVILANQNNFKDFVNTSHDFDEPVKFIKKAIHFTN